MPIKRLNSRNIARPHIARGHLFSTKKVVRPVLYGAFHSKMLRIKWNKVLLCSFGLHFQLHLLLLYCPMKISQSLFLQTQHWFRVI